MSAGDVARSLPQLSGSFSPGGFGGVPSTFGGSTTPGVSPLVASYEQWTQGRAYGNPLPRDPRVFTYGSFGPLSPIIPIGIDQPEQDGRPSPRRFTYPVAWNMPVGTPGDEGLKLAPFTVLRAVADTYSVARACISVRKQEILGLDWNITPTREAEKKMGLARTSARKDFEQRRAEAIAFFENPDPRKFHSFAGWLNAVLEEIFVTDALSVYLQPTRMPGKGLLGSSLAHLCLIDGTTVRPLLDLHGNTPEAPNPAYQIYNFGVPRVDMTTVINGDELEALGITEEDLEREYSGSQLLYLPYDPRPWTPYGFSSVEKALIPIMTGLQKQQFQLDYYSEGSVPGVFISSGNPEATPQQLRIQQDAYNSMAGDPAWKHKIIVLPNGSRIEPMRPVPLADQFDEVVMTQVCMAFDVMPMELGISPKVSTTQSPGAASQMAKASHDINQRKALRPLLLWLKDNIFDFVLQKVCGQVDMQFTWEGLEEGEELESLVNNLVNQVQHGLLSVDEARVELGRQPWGLPLSSDPVWATQMGIVPIGSIDPMTGQPLGTQIALPGVAGVTGQPAPAAPAQDTKPANPSNAKPKAPTANTPSASNQQGRQPTAAHSTADAHVASAALARKYDTHSALREIDLVRRRLKRGRGLGDWDFVNLPGEAVEILKSAVVSMDADEAVEAARRIVKSESRVSARSTVVDGASQRVASHLGSLASGLRNGSVSHAQFIDEGTSLMRQGILEGLRGGARLALQTGIYKDGVRKEEEGNGFEPDEILDGEYGDFLSSVADREAQHQQGFLWGLIQDVMAGLGAANLIDKLRARFDLYGAQVRSSYEAGFGLTSLAQNPDQWIVWHTTSAKPCVLCADRDGKSFSASSLPGWPGDGGFGGNAVAGAGMGICMGGPNCKCYLEAVDQGQSAVGGNTLQGYAETLQEQAAVLGQLQQDVDDAREAFLNTLPAGAEQRARARDAARQQIAREQGVWPADVPASQVAALLHSGTSEGFEHSGMRAVRDSVVKKKKGKKKGNPKPPPSSDAPKPEEMKPAQGRATPVTNRDRYDHQLPDKTHDVYAYLARHYPINVLEWVKTAEWRGPVKVQLSDIQFTRRPGGARNEEKVQAMVHAIHDGTPPKDPVVLVETPDSPPYHPADGYHRLAAFHDAGEKEIMAWVGKVGTDTGPWGREMNQSKLNH